MDCTAKACLGLATVLSGLYNRVLSGVLLRVLRPWCRSKFRDKKLKRHVDDAHNDLLASSAQYFTQGKSCQEIIVRDA
jgi:hypothetical protein